MGIGIWELLIILAIVLVIFGAKKLRNLGGDLGGAIKAFKTSMKDDDKPGDGPAGGSGSSGGSQPRVIDAETTRDRSGH